MSKGQSAFGSNSRTSQTFGLLSVGDFRFAVPPSVQTVRTRGDARGLRRTRLLGVPSPRYSYPSSYSDSRCCLCHGGPANFGGLGVTFVVLPTVGHCIGSLQEPTVHPTGSDYCLVAWGGQAAIAGRGGNRSVPSLIPPVLDGCLLLQTTELK